MSNNVKIDNPISLQENSKERVAFDLMKYIHQGSLHEINTKDEALSLYKDCLLAVRNPKG